MMVCELCEGKIFGRTRERGKMENEGTTTYGRQEDTENPEVPPIYLLSPGNTEIRAVRARLR